MSTPTTKIDPRVKRTRQMFKDALIALIHEKGLDKLSVQDIAERATLNRATFYSHFRDIQDLLETTTCEILNELSAALHTPLNESEKNRMLREDQPHPNFVRMLEHIHHNANVYKVMLIERRVPLFYNRLLELIFQFVSRVLDKKHADAEEEADEADEIRIGYMASAFLGVVILWLKKDAAYTPDYIAAQLTRFNKNGPLNL